MSCERTQSLMDGYLDGELDLMSHLDIERHLKNCPVCQGIHENRRAMSAAIRSHATYFAASAMTKDRFRTALNQMEGSSEPARRLPRHWLNLAASVAFAAVIGAGVTYWLARPAAENMLAQEIVSSHVRSLMVASRATDVSSSDQHTVKPWFNGKLDFSPPVLDLTSQGFTLVGGRLDYLANRPVAALVYRHRQHVINLFVWPARQADGIPRHLVQQGYQVFHWSDAAMNYWAVSDLNPDDLKTFGGLVQAQTSPR